LDPFDGSEPVKFDAILSAAQPSTLIHIGVGTFVTRGITLKEGFHLVGRGKELTTIKLADGVQSSDISSTNVVAFWGSPKPLGYIEVRDMTLDANRAGQPSFQQNLSDHYIGGIIAYVRRARITDVRVKGTWGSGGEAFVFAIVHGGGNHPDDRIEILRCENINPLSVKDGISGICAFDQEGGTFGGFIKECVVTDNLLGTGVGATGSTDFVVADNYVRNVFNGTNFDTHPNTRLDIHGNHYDGCLVYGILYNSGYLNTDIRIHDNVIVMADTATSAAIYVGETKTRSMIYNNLLIQRSNRAPALVVGPNMTGEIRDNVIQETVPTKLNVRKSAVVIENNRDFTGRILGLRGGPRQLHHSRSKPPHR
jgi:hypothetical protein